MVQVPSLLEMLQAGVHFGHQHSRWHPKMKPYIFGLRNGIHIINLETTQEELKKALEHVKQLAAAGKVILFVGIKKQAQTAVKEAAQGCGMPYLTERWIGGLMTNFEATQQQLKRYVDLQKAIESGEIEKYTKKEQGELKKRVAKMGTYLAGLVGLERLPDALYIADMRASKTAVLEAKRRGVPIIGVCDTNVNPDNAAVVIPANDDAVNSVKMIVNLVAAAVKEGKAEGEKRRAVEQKEAVKTVAPDTKSSSLVKAAAGKLAEKKVSADKAPARKERRAMVKEESV